MYFEKVSAFGLTETQIDLLRNRARDLKGHFAKPENIRILREYIETRFGLLQITDEQIADVVGSTVRHHGRRRKKKTMYVRT